MAMTRAEYEYISNNLSNFLYENNTRATHQLCNLLERIANKRKIKLNTPDDYIRMYDDNFYTYSTWGELVESEADQNEGLTEEELKEQKNKTVWRLPCGWYVQYV